ncbi:hypothetical protein E2C01_098351 [Portunus trituberculatus]|uniref:Uncharacterized protein n=1 Tax=Portunus trituberculatus TaxID=210409 RepID=A0A5B7KCP1_PORTR|nr:hypothetical protein [Portunus trituberculatus]
MVRAKRFRIQAHWCLNYPAPASLLYSFPHTRLYKACARFVPAASVSRPSIPPTHNSTRSICSIPTSHLRTS